MAVATVGVLATLVTTLAPIGAAESAAPGAAGEECRGTSWIFGYRDRIPESGPLVAPRADEHTDAVAGDTACDEQLTLLCAAATDRPTPDLSVVREEYRLPWGSVKVRQVGRVAGTQLTSQATADGICVSRLGEGWHMATTREAGAGDGYFATGRGLQAWVRINDQRANPWNTSTGKALTWTVWKDFRSDLMLAGTDYSATYSNPYRGDTPVSSYLPVLCINQDGRPVPDGGLPFIPPRGLGWSSGEFALTPRVQGSRMNSIIGADNICQRNFGEQWRMAEFHDAGGWYAWGAGNVGRLWVANVDAAANPWS